MIAPSSRPSSALTVGRCNAELLDSVMVGGSEIVLASTHRLSSPALRRAALGLFPSRATRSRSSRYRDGGLLGVSSSCPSRVFSPGDACGALPEHPSESVIHRLNEHPRFNSMPDCISYDLSPNNLGSSTPCEPGIMRFTVAGPQLTDELLVRVAAEAASGNQGPRRYRLTLHQIVGSMMNKFRQPLGSDLGTLITKAGSPSELLLGPALLPSEIGVARVVVDTEN